MIRSETIEYTLDKQSFEGVLCWDDALEGRRPGILVSHAWFGQRDFEVDKAKELARMGYIAFAIDMYGKDRRATNADEASKLMAECVADGKILKNRILNALQTFQGHPLVDTDNIGAIGFCFGGRCVLDLARTGVAIKGVASFHGIYDPPNITNDGPINAAVLVLHGWEDPLATPTQTISLARELTERKADWQILAFGHTAHAFTNPNASSPQDGMAYHTKSNRRAWQAMTYFFKELFD